MIDALRPLLAEPDRWPLEPRDLQALLRAPSIGPLNRPARAGVLREVLRTKVRAAWDDSHDRPAVAHARITLSDEQREALGRIESTLGAFAAHLLRGVTGSGKTEVYLDAIERAGAWRIGDRAGAGDLADASDLARFLTRFRREGVAVLPLG